MNRKIKNFGLDLVVFTIGTLGSKMLLFLLVPLYTNTLTTIEYGMADLVISTGQLILPFTSLTISNAVLRFGLQSDVKRENILLSASVVYVLSFVLTLAARPLLTLYEPISEWVWYLIGYLNCMNASMILMNYLKAKNKNVQYSILSITQAALSVLLGFWLLAIRNYGISGYLLSNIIPYAGTAILAAFFCGFFSDVKHAVFQPVLCKQMILYSLPFVVNDVSWWLFNSANKFIIDWKLGGVTLGLFTVASKIPSMLNVLTTIFTQAWNIASIKECDDSNDTDFFSKIFNYYIIVVFGACLLLCMLIRPIMKVYVSEEFFAAWRYVPLLLVGASVSAIGSYANSLQIALKRSKNIMFITVFGGVVNVLCGIGFTFLIGVWGVLLSTVISYLVITIMRLLDVYKYIKVDFQIKKLSMLFLICLCQALLVSFGIEMLPISVVALVLFLICVRKDIVGIYYIFINVGDRRRKK